MVFCVCYFQIFYKFGQPFAYAYILIKIGVFSLCKKINIIRLSGKAFIFVIAFNKGFNSIKNSTRCS